MNDVRLRFVDLRRNLSRFLLQTTTMLFMIVTLSLANSSLSAENESADDANDVSRPRVFLLSVADYRSYEASALQGVKHDVRTVKTFFRRHVPAQLFEYMQVNPKAATRKAVLDAINKPVLSPLFLNGEP